MGRRTSWLWWMPSPIQHRSHNTKSESKDSYKIPGWQVVLYLWNFSLNPWQSEENFWQPYNRALVQIIQNTTIHPTPYNPHRILLVKIFMTHCKMYWKYCQKHQGPISPNILSTLVFAYNATPHSTTGYQPYQVIFSYKAPTPCDNLLGLKQYNNIESVSKNSWVQGAIWSGTDY